jgi:predicted amidophosphoribosyltransferase
VLLAFAGSLPHDTRNCPGCDADVEKSKRRCRDCGYEFGRGS